MIDLILMVILMAFSIDILLVYKYKIMYKSKHKFLLAFLHASILLVNLFFIFYLGFIYQNKISIIINIVGVIFVLLGMLLTVYTLVFLKEIAILPKNKLITGGPFKYSRHPIYLGYMLAVIGLSFFFGSLYLLIYSIALAFALNYLAKQEEKELVNRFGKVYLDYIKKVKRFLN